MVTYVRKEGGSMNLVRFNVEFWSRIGESLVPFVGTEMICKEIAPVWAGPVAPVWN
jgi:hypothetical protein